MIVRIPARGRERSEEARLLQRQLERAELYLVGALNVEGSRPDLRRRLERIRGELNAVLQSLPG